MSNKSGASSQIISLPKGGGALRGLDEKLTTDLSTGTARLAVPVPLPSLGHGPQPDLTLRYSSAGGNGPFGMGWSLDLPGLERMTSRGIPRYGDADVLVLAGAGELVSVDAARRHYRPRVETAFTKVERVANDGWRLREGSGLVHELRPGIVHGPTGRIFSWVVEETRDPFQNRIVYEWTRAQGSDGASRLTLSRVRFGEIGEPGASRFVVEVKFGYENRDDVVRSHRPGFAVETAVRCTRIEIATDVDRPRLLRSVDLSYAPGHRSLLQAVRINGHDGERSETLPPLSFAYTPFDSDERRFVRVRGEGAPPALGGSTVELADLFSRGLPDVVELSTTSRYWRNRGDGSFDPPREMPGAPAGVSLADHEVQLVDADGDGSPDVLVTRPGRPGFYPLDAGGLWHEAGFKPQRNAPTIDLQSLDVRLLDLTGDGITDALRTAQSLEHFFQHPGDGWEPPLLVPRGPIDAFPNVDFTDRRVKLGDMTGDGLQDIVLVDQGEVAYWPNLGHGSWGQRVILTPGPNLPAGFASERVLLGDIDGDGAADLVYVDSGQVLIWLNRSGRTWEGPIEIPNTPDIGDLDSVRLVDLLGTGMAGLFWTFEEGESVFLELSGGRKPNLMAAMDNHRGARATVEYTSSTRLQLEDDVDPETRWRTRLPFPLQVVSRLVLEDQFSQNRLVTAYRYRHGTWDGQDRELRGFARVDVRDAEPSHSPVETRHWFDVGPVRDEPLDLRHEYWPGDRSERPVPQGLPRPAQRAMKGLPLRVETYGLDGGPLSPAPYQVTDWRYAVREEAPGVWFPHQLVRRETAWERGNEPLTHYEMAHGHDGYGRPTSETNLAPPREVTGEYLGVHKEIRWADRDDVALYCIDRPAVSVEMEVVGARGDQPAAAIHAAILAGDVALTTLREERHHYDGEAFVGLAVGVLGEQGARTRTERLALGVADLGRLFPDGLPPHFSESPVWPPEIPAGYGPPRALGYRRTGEGLWIEAERVAYGPRGVVVAQLDALDARTDIEPDAALLLPGRVIGPTGLVERAEYDPRTLMVGRHFDANGNETAYRWSPMGLLSSIARLARPGDEDGDTLEAPGLEISYDFGAFAERGQPIGTTTRERRWHVRSRPGDESDLIVTSVELSDGFGRPLQTRAAAEAVQREEVGLGSTIADGQTPAVGREVDESVVVSGWQAYDGKGRVVRKFEPHFSSGWDLETPTEATRSVRIAFDPVGRPIETTNPDGSAQTIRFGRAPDESPPSPWFLTVADENDNAGRTHARGSRVPERVWNTPTVTEIDALCRARYETRVLLDEQISIETLRDIDGEILSQIDPLGRPARELVRDRLGRVWFEKTLDGGETLRILDAAGRVVDEQDAKGARRLTTHDLLNRPARRWARDRAEGSVTLRERYVYGDDVPDAEQQGANRLGRLHVRWDEAGKREVRRYDFKGNVIEEQVRLLRDEVLVGGDSVDWTDPSAENVLEVEELVTTRSYDAQNRMTSLTTPAENGRRRRQRWRHNVRGLIEGVSIGTRVVVSHVAYNARGQDVLVAGSGVMTRRAYDDQQRFARQRTERCALAGTTYAGVGAPVEDVEVAYDFVGNLVHAREEAPDCGVPGSPGVLVRELAYDAQNRLISAEGRISGAPRRRAPWDARPRPTDVGACRRYRERYKYDLAGNLRVLRHSSTGASYRRTLDVAAAGNRLERLVSGTTEVQYVHDDAGNLISEGGTRTLSWDHANRLRHLAVRPATGPASQEVWYAYDANGERRKRVLVKGGVREVTTCVAGIWTRHQRTREGRTTTRTEVSITCGERRVGRLRVGTKRAGDDAPGFVRQVTDHLGSVRLELDDRAEWVRREEHSPFGETTFGGGVGKRHRFTGKERDPESGWDHFGARYYAPYLGRWLSIDRQYGESSQEGVRLSAYAYVDQRPLTTVDPDGDFAWVIVILIGLGAGMLSESPANAPENAEQVARARGPTSNVETAVQAAWLALSASRITWEFAKRGLGAWGASATLGAGSSVGSLGISDGFRGEASSLWTYAKTAIGGALFGLAVHGAGRLLGMFAPKGGSPIVRTTPRPAVVEGAPQTGTLTAAEQRALQQVADTFRTEIDVIGSRAAGRGRNIATDLPPGKGPGTKSDIDVRIDPEVDIGVRGALSNALKNIGGGRLVDVRSRLPGGSTPPVILIKPRSP